jgi:hypothetical protein
MRHVAALVLLVASASAQAAMPFSQGPKLVGDNAVGAGRQGSAVALSADGSTALVGALTDGSSKGAGFVFTRSGGTWRQQAKLVTAEAGVADLGASVALSADGNTALLGGPLADGFAGAAWVFVRSGTIWSQQQKLVGTAGGSFALQGSSVALSGDGNTAVLGGPASGASLGGAWVFTRSGNVWTQQGPKLVGQGIGAGNQGLSVGISADGSTLISGGPNDAGSAGGAWVFTRSAGVWTQQGPKLVGTDAAGTAQQGTAVALSADGSTAVVGGSRDATNMGAAWVFTRSAGVWTQQGPKLVGSGVLNNAFQGHYVALSGDGRTALLGGYGDEFFHTYAWVFARSGNVWTQVGDMLERSGRVGSIYYAAVALSADGTTALVGGQTDHEATGAAWVFTRTCTRGEVSGDGVLDVIDVFYLINYLFAGGAAPACS